MLHPDHAIEERLGVLIVEGQRHDIWVRSEADDDGTWHNALLFRRGGKLGPAEALVAGVGWHVPPGIALERALELGEKEQLELFYRALRPRPPIV
ncbi:MAG TPA: hypothetical protein VFQ38_14125 [Longimicrobiales bacterium]|nr:hypothetical protein [Longimicrobiales bacterium]